MEKIYFINIEEIIKFQKLLINEFGGSHGIRDKGLLESACTQPQIKVFGKHVHQTIYDMAAAYMFHLIKNHPFVDGNKRVGAFISTLFLEYNLGELEISNENLYKITMQTANSKISKKKIAKFFKDQIEN